MVPFGGQTFSGLGGLGGKFILWDFGFFFSIDAWPMCGMMYTRERGKTQTLDTMVGAMTLLLVHRCVDIDDDAC